jgi:CheY-like chemotaxis protein
LAATCAKTEPARRVLVVEDDHAICELIRDLLEPLNLQTVCAMSDRAAYDTLRVERSFAAVLLDVNLGAGTTGFDVARFARQVMPDVAVIYISGQASQQSFMAFGVPNSEFLAKPFTAEELVKVVRARVPSND